MNIVFVTSEAHPYAKTGGLADVAFSLPAALARRGHKVSVIMPYYKQQMNKLKIHFTSVHTLLGVPFGPRTEWTQVLEHRLDPNLSFYFIEFNIFYDRASLYDWYGNEFSDNAERYIFLSRAAMQAVMALRLKPDIMHTNDWHTGLVNVYLHSPLYKDDENFKNCKSVMTIHNIGYQGVFDKNNIYWTGLGWQYFNVHCLEFYDKINLLKGGILTADMVNTVSPTYAREILSPAFSFNLEAPLTERAMTGKLRGIINGINILQWSPENDSMLPAKYTKDNFAGKDKCKKELQKHFKLPVKKDMPLFTVISRLASQKGIDVLCDSLEDLLETEDYQFIIVGSGDKGLQDRLNYLHSLYPAKLAVYIGYCSDELAHLVEAGGDMFIMPSRYEPCGLNQMYSMRYGTLPVVRATGGLDDTVQNLGASHTPTGFKFWDLYPVALANTIRWAASVYNHDRDTFRRMQVNAMEQDFSWNHTASLYEQLYEDAHRTF
jgi:starch synthase